ncbi:DUF5320 domain-containing protein [Streptomyces africanus]|uniref:DUF5320 domain-containing protein n=1 Tax=Streptomyces africanus TaxID=231024 RepID=UPI000A3C56C4|nr:DUF5320 domain-containing protein [Streptomyces africanus]
MIRNTTADDTALQALSEAGAVCGDCDTKPGDRTCANCERCRRWYVAALRAAGWAPRSELQQQIDQAQTELDAIKRKLASLTRQVSQG